MAKYKIIPSSRTIVRSPISIGHKAEKGVEAIEFDLTAWVETYGSGTLTVIMRRWGDAIPYPIALEIDENNKATWTLSDIDTAKAGMAYAQLSYIVGDEVVKKSDIYTFCVMDSLTGEGDPPEAYESWLEHLQHLAAEAMAEVLDIEGIVTDKTLTVDGGIADAKKTGDELSDINADLEDLDDRVEALEGGSGGGLTPSIKNALLACFANVAWKDDDGQTYYDALEDALFPEATLSSISAVYVQSGTVYFDTPLNDLKTDLVVTAYYSNGTSATVSSGYTLTGILTAGTSAITVEYGGKTTTFNVTVTSVLYPFENGTHNFTSPASQVTVSNGNTAVITASTANHNDTHANISELTTNTTACNATGNYTGISDPYITIPAGSTLSCKATITSLVYPINTSNAALAFRDMSGTAVLIMFANYNLSNMTVGQEFSESITVESATDIGCVGLFLGRKANGNECEIGVKIEAYLDGVRII